MLNSFSEEEEIIEFVINIWNNSVPLSLYSDKTKIGVLTELKPGNLGTH